MQKIAKTPIVISIVMLLIALLPDLPYGYYTLLRLVVCGTSAYMCVMASANGSSPWTWVCGALAVLFNPVIPIHFDRSTWSFIDVLTAGIFFVYLIFWGWKEKARSRVEPTD